MKILALGAHPDDIEFGCAALLLQEADAGAVVRMLVLSRGEAASAGTPEEREQEARQAAALIGGEVAFLDFHGDCHLDASSANALRLAAEIRRFQPDIVLAPFPDENQHPDHAACGKLARDACRLARYAGLVDLKALAPHRIRQLYFYDITQHGVRAPDLVIDISAVAARWEAAMRCHASQLATKSYVELQLSAARLLGLTIGVEYAAGLYANDPIRIERLGQLALSSRNF